MNSDFEKQLQQQSLKKIPTAWRAEILQAAPSAASRPASPIGHHISWWRELLWPCPQAWAGLVAVWGLIVVLNFSGNEGGTAKSSVAARPQEIQTVLLERRRELSRLLDSFSPVVVPVAPGPRSERRRAIAFA